jgi:hypothetical protein
MAANSYRLDTEWGRSPKHCQRELRWTIVRGQGAGVPARRPGGLNEVREPRGHTS